MALLYKQADGRWKAVFTTWRHRSLFYRDPALSGSDRPERFSDEVLAWLREHGHEDEDVIGYGFDGTAAIYFSDERTALAFKMRWL